MSGDLKQFAAEVAWLSRMRPTFWEERRSDPSHVTRITPGRAPFSHLKIK